MFGTVLPELPAHETVHYYWQELGQANLMSMGGFSGFQWQEIAAFNSVTNYNLHPEILKTLMDMSRAFADAYSDTNPLSKAPMERV